MSEYKYEVEKGVPQPTPRDMFLKYPWKVMDVGDSFFVPDSEISSRQNFHSCAKNRGIKISTRRVDDGIRVWRIA